MQTFCPYLTPERCALVLDVKRLGKQRVEAKQVLQALLDIDKWGMPGNTGQAFTNHPIMEMWRGNEEALLSYTWYICKEWKNRDYRDSVMPWLFRAARRRQLLIRPWHKTVLPWWWGEPKLHVLHRANLLVKNPLWYGTRPADLGLRPWVIPERYRTGFGYNWPLADQTWRLIRRDE